MTRTLNQLQPWALCLVRLVLGVAMTLAGYDKVIPAGGLHRAHPLAGFDAWNHSIVAMGLPYWIGYITLVTELLGGLLLIAGLLTRLSAFMVVITLALLFIKVDVHHGYAGFEPTLALLVMAVLLVTTGSGALSLDRRLGLS